MTPRGRFLVRWTVLSVTALLLGTGIGTVYALNFKDPELAMPEDPWDTSPPGAPALTSPKHKAVVRSSTPEFAWAAAPDVGNGNLMYTIEFAYDPAFGRGTFREYTNIYTTTFQVPGNEPFAPGLEVYWRVYAIDAGINQGPYSAVFAFTPFGSV